MTELRVDTRVVQRELTVEVQAEELSQKAVAAACKRHEAAVIQAKIDEHVGPLKKKIKELRAEADYLEKIVGEGAEKALVECVEHRDFSRGVVWVTRTDTGEIVEHERPMRDDERQREIVLDQAQRAQASQAAATQNSSPVAGPAAAPVVAKKRRVKAAHIKPA